MQKNVILERGACETLSVEHTSTVLGKMATAAISLLKGGGGDALMAIGVQMRTEVLESWNVERSGEGSLSWSSQSGKLFSAEYIPKSLIKRTFCITPFPQRIRVLQLTPVWEMEHYGSGARSSCGGVLEGRPLSRLEQCLVVGIE